MTNVLLFRKKFNLTQEEMSDIIGRTQRTYRDKEKGKKDFTIHEAISIYLVFKKFDEQLTIEDIFFNNKLNQYENKKNLP